MKTFEEYFWGNEASGILPIARDTDRILIGLRSGGVLEPYTWGNFGGAIGLDDDGNEESKMSPSDNAIKEMSEELGYTGEIELIPSYIFTTTNFKYYNFIGIIPNEIIINNSELNWEVSEVKWVTLDELISLDNKHFGIQGLLDNSMNLIKKWAK